ncbi:MARVEL domain-containing protein [Trichonephila clavata]|uniref:MARVEL domain-containing protein n=1 Tax=Trichonephila clavata TaxID=2740835 RepID=A0A8X6J7M1_TRICU|nr:MARVEL domain-containing protein [Trichonephila clavata]
MNDFTSCTRECDVSQANRTLFNICAASYLLFRLLRIIGLCGIICVSEGAYCGQGGIYSFYNTVVVSTLIIAILLLIVYVLGLQKFCTFINCFMSAFITDVLFTVLYLIATILMIITIGSCRYGQVARIFAVLFGICGTVVVGLLALFGYQIMRGNQSVPKTEPA